jgi:hypothetical protein
VAMAHRISQVVMSCPTLAPNALTLQMEASWQ